MGFLHTWDAKAPQPFEYVENHTNTEPLDLGGGVVVGVRGVQLIAKGGRKRVFFHHTKPGIFGLYYGVNGTKIAVGTSKHEVKAVIGKATQVKEGVVHVFEGKEVRTFRGDTLPVPSPEAFDNGPLHDKAETLWNLLVESAEEVYNNLKTPEDQYPLIVTPVSGGTDGMLTALALKTIGANQLCVCVGTSPNDFDPFHAAQYAKQLGLPYEYLQLPETDAALIALRNRAIASFEACDFSNVLMGMCYALIGDYAKEHGAVAVFNADFADVVLGNDILSTGNYKKRYREGEFEDSDVNWSKYRIDHLIHTLPTSVMTVKIFDAMGLKSRQIFYHRDIIDFLLSQTRDITPVATDKKLYKAILNCWIPEGVWNNKKKVGFYTGAGIGKIRLKNPILQDANLRLAYQRIFKEKK